MSKTVLCEWRGEALWAYDVALGLFLRHLIEIATEAESPDAWLATSISNWRVNAVVSDFALHLDPDWSAVQVDAVIGLIERVCKRIADRPAFTAAETRAWNVLDGRGVELRGADEFPVEPVIELGRAIGELLDGTLPPAPPQSWWLFGVDGGRRTIGKRTERD